MHFSCRKIVILAAVEIIFAAGEIIFAAGEIILTAAMLFAHLAFHTHERLHTRISLRHTPLELSSSVVYIFFIFPGDNILKRCNLIVL